ncbi:AbrB/MazE/SpoVT family DNA-binding domain-containing protein [Candidatus Woesearchaeota archaeon]|nr:AbrB/MazE/SpoVT family DNA-binding domain-containing protein [Candidatus Woesearchaeota archaeon]
MAEIETVARKWGGSLAVIIPKKIADRESIKADDRVHLTNAKEHDLTDLFGKWSTKNSAQELKDESRKVWE